MKLGVFAVLLSDRSFEEALDYIANKGLTQVEIGCGGFIGDAHCKPSELLENRSKLKEMKKALQNRNLSVSALSVHGNPLHPNKDLANKHHQSFYDAVKIAHELETDTIVTFSGCPGDSENAKYPNWATATWPTDFREILDWQWNEKVIPYWQSQGQHCKENGVKVAIEPHPGFVVYNNETFVKLRDAVGDVIGVNFDPSHLFWQQMDVEASIYELGNTIYHVHAKDTALNKKNIAANGVLDTKPYSQVLDRSWVFRTVGYGHGPEEWNKIISALQATGYEGAISIEHEDPLMSTEEGFQKAVSFLRNIVITEKNSAIWWD